MSRTQNFIMPEQKRRVLNTAVSDEIKRLFDSYTGYHDYTTGNSADRLLLRALYHTHLRPQVEAILKSRELSVNDILEDTIN